MSASTEPDRRGGDPAEPAGILAAAWRPGGLLYLAACLLGLAVGVFPATVFPRRGVVPAPVPALQTLAVFQGAFGLLVVPVLSFRRLRRRPHRRLWGEDLIEAACWMLLTVPLYIPAAWLADATAADAVRAALAVACTWPLGRAAGAVLARRPRARAGMLLGLLVVFALPAAWYVAREFLAGAATDTLWDLAPLTWLWQQAASRAGRPIPRPLWPAATWLALAAALAVAGVRRSPSRPADAA